MKKYINFFFAVPVILLSITLSGCIKDACHRTYNYSYYQPVYKTTAEVKANIKSNTPVQIQNPGKIYIRGNYIFLNEVDKGIHIIDNSNPSFPVNKAFITIPGNIDMAVKGNILYADLYTDLVTIDISDPLNAIVKKYNEGVFPFRSYGNGFSADKTKIIVEWEKRDTTVTEDCSMREEVWIQNSGGFFMADAGIGGDSKASVSPVGLGGSMARFTLVNNRMYTVSYSDLNIFNITSPENPVFSNKVNINNWNIETIFPFKDKLFIGSQTGMFVYSINNPDNPALTGEFAHAVSCDPVIADDNFAYVTLRSGNACRGITNQLDILRLNNFSNVQLLKTYNLTNPHGLSKDGNHLFICDGTAGLKVYDASDVLDLKLVKQITNLETYDVIAYNKIALVIAKGGLYQYDYSNINNIQLLSKIEVTKN